MTAATVSRWARSRRAAAAVALRAQRCRRGGLGTLPGRPVNGASAGPARGRRTVLAVTTSDASHEAKKLKPVFPVF